MREKETGAFVSRCRDKVPADQFRHSVGDTHRLPMGDSITAMGLYISPLETLLSNTVSARARHGLRTGEGDEGPHEGERERQPSPTGPLPMKSRAACFGSAFGETEISSKMMIRFVDLTFAFPSGHLGPCTLSHACHTFSTVTGSSVGELT